MTGGMAEFLSVRGYQDLQWLMVACGVFLAVMLLVEWAMYLADEE